MGWGVTAIKGYPRPWAASAGRWRKSLPVGEPGPGRVPLPPPGGRGSLSSVLPPGEGEAQGAGRDRSYATLSHNYLNLNLHLGYLRFTGEAYITEQVIDHYITFGFRESGSTLELRAIWAPDSGGYPRPPGPEHPAKRGIP